MPRPLSTTVMASPDLCSVTRISSPKPLLLAWLSLNRSNRNHSGEYVVDADAPARHRRLCIRSLPTSPSHWLIRRGTAIAVDRLGDRIDVPDDERARREIVDPLGEDF